MTMFHRFLASLSAGILVAACSSPSPSTSSSSHWVTCRNIDDCSDVPEAAACTAGYCVDSSGARLRVSTSTPDASTSPRPCDPLTPRAVPITLGTVLGAGRDASGTLYVADEAPSVPNQLGSTPNRVFVSQGTTLFRKVVTGSGSSGGGAEADYTFSFEDGAESSALLIQVRGGKTTAMGLGPANSKGFIGDPGAVTTMLTVQDSSAVSAFTLQNLPGDVAIEYVADVDDGQVVVVTHPKYDYTYTDFRLFLGQPDNLLERRVEDVSRTRSSDTLIQFLVGNSQARAHFTYVLEPATDGGIISHPGPGTLSGFGPDQSMTQRFPTPTTLDGLSFTCL